jgi:hypothetical protein
VYIRAPLLMSFGFIRIRNDQANVSHHRGRSSGRLKLVGVRLVDFRVGLVIIEPDYWVKT